MKLVRHIAWGIAALPLLGGAAHAQVVGNASVNATVHVSGNRSIVLSANGINNLVFGIINAGSPHTPASLAADAGRFGISGSDNTPITINFVLPAALHGPGIATIPITFGPTDGLEWIAYPLSLVQFDPNAPHLATLNAVGSAIVGITGTVTPPLGTPTGFYTGTIILQVSY